MILFFIYQSTIMKPVLKIRTNCDICDFILQHHNNSHPMADTTQSIGLSLIERKYTFKSRIHISLITWSLAMALFHFGYDLIYITFIPYPTLAKIYKIELEKGLTQGILNGVVPIGALFGALGSSLFIEKISRRMNMLFANIFAFVIGCIIYIQYFPMLIFCRFCQGLAVGYFTSIAPLMVREQSPTEIAGAIGSFTELNIAIGTLVGCLAPYIMQKVTGDDTAEAYWYLVFGIPQIIILIQTSFILFVFPYQTPKYLMSVGKYQEARVLIQIIYKREYTQQVYEQKRLDLKKTELKLSLMKSIQAERKANNESCWSAFTIPVLVSLNVAALQQLSGINIVSIYAEPISEEVTTGQLALALPSIINFVQVIATMCSYFVLSAIGRRKILLFGALISGISNILIMIGFIYKDNTSFGQPLLLIGIFVFILNFSLTLGPVTWIYIPEIVDPDVIPFTITVSWLSGSFVVILFPILTEDFLDSNPAILFAFSAALCLGAAVINYFFVLETKDKIEKDIRNEYKRLKVCDKQNN